MRQTKAPLLNWRLFFAGWIFFTQGAALAGDAQTSWNAECVGRFQMSVPGDVEVAVSSFQNWLDENNAGAYRFLDGTLAPYSKIVGVEISSAVSGPDFEAYQNRMAVNAEKQIRDLRDSYRNDLADSIKPFATNFANSFGWMNKNGRTIYAHIGGRVLIYSSSSSEGISSFMKAFRPRPLYTIPIGPGVCIPYGFIADDGKAGRHVAVTMRLITHPDVEIFFSDQTAPQPYKTGAHQADSKHLNFFFLEEQAHDTKGIKVLFPGYHSATLGGYPATASFFEIKRKDDVVDYGYAANVAGDYTAKTDTPQLMMYVIRTASRATGKPVSKNELKDMAQKIAASIKRREVK